MFSLSTVPQLSLPSSTIIVSSSSATLIGSGIGLCCGFSSGATDTPAIDFSTAAFIASVLRVTVLSSAFDSLFKPAVTSIPRPPLKLSPRPPPRLPPKLPPRPPPKPLPRPPPRPPPKPLPRPPPRPLPTSDRLACPF